MNSGQWWESESETAHRDLCGLVDRIRSSDKSRTDLDMRHVRLYGGRAFSGFLPTNYYKPESVLADSARLTWNVIQSICDAVQAKIGKNKPKPVFLTQGGEWSQQKRAKGLSKFVDGVFYEADAYAKGQRVLLDAEITGTGAMQVGFDGTKITLERVLPWELYVDPVEALYGEPANLYRTKHVPRTTLLAMFPGDDVARRIKDASSSRAPWATGIDCDQILVTEAWHLPTGIGDDVGRHVIAIPDITLLDEEWTRPRFPFAFLRWAELPLGFWGQGIAERITGVQVEINSILRDIQERFHLCSMALILAPKGSKIEKKQVVNQNGAILEYIGDVPPQIVTFATTHPEVFNHLDRLYQRAFDQIGASQLSATSRKPSGLDSGAALREYNDIETERFVIDGQAYEQFFLDLARLVLDEAGAHDVQVRAVTRTRRRSAVEVIKWADVRLDEDAYIMKAFPTSSLPSNPAGRTATIEQWIAAGMITKEEGMQLLDFPDLEAHNSLSTSAYEVVLDAIERMIEAEEFVSPEPYQDLELTLRLTQAAYNRARLDGVPEASLQLLRDYMAKTEDLKAMMAPPAPPAPMAPPMAG